MNTYIDIILEHVAADRKVEKNLRKRNFWEIAAYQGFLIRRRAHIFNTTYSMNIYDCTFCHDTEQRALINIRASNFHGLLNNKYSRNRL